MYKQDEITPSLAFVRRRRSSKSKEAAPHCTAPHHTAPSGISRHTTGTTQSEKVVKTFVSAPPLPPFPIVPRKKKEKRSKTGRDAETESEGAPLSPHPVPYRCMVARLFVPTHPPTLSSCCRSIPTWRAVPTTTSSSISVRDKHPPLSPAERRSRSASKPVLPRLFEISPCSLVTAWQHRA